jgi:hypothetical protein
MPENNSIKQKLDYDEMNRRINSINDHYLSVIKWFSDILSKAV